MPTPGHENDQWVGATNRRGVRRRVAFVVGLVVRAVRLVKLAKPGNAVLDGSIRRKIKDQRLDLGSQEVIGAAGAKFGQSRMFAVGQEFQHPSSSVKCPTIGLSNDAMDRNVGASAAALARRSSSGSAEYPSSRAPNGSGLECSSM